MTPSCKHLLIDGRNVLYRSIYAGLNDKKFQKSGDDYFTIIVRFIHHYYQLFRPESIHIFWDDSSENLWRTEFYPEYKATRDNSDIIDILKRQYRLCLDLFRFFGFRQYYRKQQEADDLIYAFCRSFKEPTIIISSDSDLRQIPYFLEHVEVFNPSTRAKTADEVIFEDSPTNDVTIAKALIGDKADNIEGYRGVGPVKGNQYTNNVENRIEFLKQVDEEIYRRNRILIDLSLCPHLLDNMIYVEKHSISPVKYDYKTVITKFRENSVSGAIAEADKYIVKFAELK